MTQKAFKAFALLMFMLGAAVPVLAEETDAEADVQTAKFLLVTEKSGTEVAVALAEQPVLTFAEGVMTVAYDSDTLWVNLADIASYTIVDMEVTASEDETVGIQQTLVNGKAEFINGKVYLSGLEANAPISVYTIDGKQTVATKAAADGTAVVDLTTLKTGTVYVLRTPGASYKMISK